MTVDKITLTSGLIKPIKDLQPQSASETVTSGKKTSFLEMFSKAVREVDGMQKSAEGNMEQMVLGKNSNPHEAMIALERADVAFQLMNTVRSKIIRAYEEIMRTPV